jgi:ribosomal protein S12 methylthiotransferase accessory factor
LVDAEVGIITKVREFHRAPDEFGLFNYLVLMAHTGYHRLGSVRGDRGTGWGLTRQEALGKAIGEALESYSVCMHWGLVEFIRAPLNEVRGHALDPRAMSLVSPQESAQLADIPNAPVLFDPDAPMLWMWGIALDTNQPVLVPVAMAYVPYPFPYGDPRIWEATTNGLASGPSLKAAILAGLLEVVERDAFLIAWWNRLPCVRLPSHVIASEPQLGPLLERIAYKGLELVVNDITMETGIPSYCAWLVDRSGRLPAASLGAAACLDPHKALRKAIVEVCQVYRHLHRVSKRYGEQWPDFGADYRGVRTFEDRTLLYSRPDMLGELEFLLQAPYRDRALPASLASGDMETDLAACLNRLADAGMHVYFVDLTVPEVEAGGFHAVHVLVTGAQHLPRLGCVRLLANPRLYRVPRLLGYTGHDTCPDDINPLPHPFP